MKEIRLSQGYLWLAQIRVDGRQIYLGLFDDILLAAAASFSAAATEHHREFARLNFPQEIAS